MDHRSADRLLVLSTLAALAAVPDWPHRHPTDPSYWGVLGFVVLVIALLPGRRGSWSPGGRRRRAILAFLALVQVVYLADVFRFGGTPLEAGIQVAGLGCWLFVALRARRSDLALWLGCVLHALWDAGHFGRVAFVPEWYAAACLAADIGLGAYVLLHLENRPGPEPAHEALGTVGP